MRTLFIATILVCHLAGADTYNCDEFSSVNYAILRNQDMFTTWNVGIGGVTPKHMYAYRCIKKDENAAMIFESLIENSTLVGQLYGLRGLSEVDPERYKELKIRYEFNDEFVRYMSGCVVSYRKASDMAMDFGVQRERLRTQWKRYLQKEEKRRRQLAEDIRTLREIKKRMATH